MCVRCSCGGAPRMWGVWGAQAERERRLERKRVRSQNELRGTSYQVVRALASGVLLWQSGPPLTCATHAARGPGEDQEDDKEAAAAGEAHARGAGHGRRRIRGRVREVMPAHGRRDCTVLLCGRQCASCGVRAPPGRVHILCVCVDYTCIHFHCSLFCSAGLGPRMWLVVHPLRAASHSKERRMHVVTVRLQLRMLACTNAMPLARARGSSRLLTTHALGRRRTRARAIAHRRASGRAVGRPR